MPQTEQERLEIIQDLIDRLLYLPETDRKVFMRILSSVFHDFPIHYDVVDGVRIYKHVKRNNNGEHVQL